MFPEVHIVVDLSNIWLVLNNRLGGRLFLVDRTGVMYNLLKYFRYQSTLFGSYQTVELIETFMNYQVIKTLHCF